MATRSVWRLAVPLVLAFAGVLMATSAATARGTDLRADRRTDLADLIREQARRATSREAAVQSLRADVSRLTASQGAADGRVGAAQAQARDLGTPVGLTALSGPGLTVTLDDAHRDPSAALPSGVTPDDLVIHQQDVQAVVNALWAGSADAVTVMDQRLVATSAVRCVGNTLILNGRVYSPPFTVTALGDPLTLRHALDASPEVTILRGWVDAVGLGYQLQDSRRTSVPAYSGTLALRYASAQS